MKLYHRMKFHLWTQDESNMIYILYATSTENVRYYRVLYIQMFLQVN